MAQNFIYVTEFNWRHDYGTGDDEHYVFSAFDEAIQGRKDEHALLRPRVRG